IGSAPTATDYLCSECKEHWNRLQDYLKLAEIPCRINHRLVRGLDYYTRTVFEIQPPEEGGQSTIVGGGRYDGLIEALGGRPTPGIGFGSGIERLILNLKRQDVPVPEEYSAPVLIACLGEQAHTQGLKTAAELRKAGIPVIIPPASRSLRSQMRYASAMQGRFTVIIGENELARGAVVVRDMDAGSQEDVTAEGLLSYLQARISR
ncbi:MAG: His/Gly/Thr/Pro-type tRNA ligase C-terminal domain-containing protein, partial [Chloroflexota bacterium]